LASLKIYDLAGHEIATLLEGFQAAGEHEVKWQTPGLASGVYLYKFQAGGFEEVKKLIFQK